MTLRAWQVGDDVALIYGCNGDRRTCRVVAVDAKHLRVRDDTGSVWIFDVVTGTSISPTGRLVLQLRIERL